MSYEAEETRRRKEERKLKRERRQTRRRISVILIGIYFLTRWLLPVLGFGHKTIQPKQEVVIDSTTVDAALIKIEDVHAKNVVIDSTERDNEGERVPIGHRVGNTNLLENIEDIKNELDLINEAISLKSKSEEEIREIEIINKEIEAEQIALAESIQLNIGNFKEIKEIKSMMNENKEKSVDLEPNNDFLKHDIDQLVTRKEELDEKVVKNSKMFTTKSSGIISYKLDGFEEEYSSTDWSIYTYDKLEKDMKKEKKEIEGGFKVIDNFYWYIALKIDDIQSIKKYDIGDLVRVSIETDENEDFSEEIVGKTIAINSFDNREIIIVRFNNHLEDYYKERFPKVKIINSKESGYKIPKECIVTKDGIDGVYVREFTGIVRFKPVLIGSEDKEFAYVYEGDNGTITLRSDDEEAEESIVETIGLYDEILVNTKNIKEGEILN